MRNIDRQRGDTLIEVMLAITIAAVVVVMIMTLMNAGLSSLQNSIERSQVRSSMQGQISALQYIRDDYMATSGTGVTGDSWESVTNPSPPPLGYLNSVGSSPISISDTTTISDCESKVQTTAFYVDTSVSSPVKIEKYTGTILGTLPIAQPGEHMWIESYPPGIVLDSIVPGAVDIVVHACWEPLGGGALKHETTVVRLYDGS
ncbi:prepilin-type N-terminal cleavage/methylation domain-containing protein [Candidatus Saccharibacteria bacterium]|nr:prepilin-type N-terminal cleavage/methylation domain-containing protein [Candidatus Saccharibacteria bacterium]NCU40526.1 prepilin-type N-terminal cleavage/methylation domain-containing protein [Candidatus Saccharibacteria bacterium]